MDNTLSIITRDVFGQSGYVVESGYLRSRIELFEEKYRDKFSMGWSEFYIAYSKNELPQDNLDYDEWGFLCEQMLYEQTESSPPNGCVDYKERPETDSGLSYWRADSQCSIQKPISIA
jgi:hypothetical protein